MRTSPWNCSSPGSSVIKAEEGQGDYTAQKPLNHGAQPSPSAHITTWLNFQRIWGGRKRSQLRPGDQSPHRLSLPSSPCCAPQPWMIGRSGLFFSFQHLALLAPATPPRPAHLPPSQALLLRFSSCWGPPPSSSLDPFLMSAHSLRLSGKRMALNTIPVLTIPKFISAAQTSPLDSRLCLSNWPAPYFSWRCQASPAYDGSNETSGLPSQTCSAHINHTDPFTA